VVFGDMRCSLRVTAHTMMPQASSPLILKIFVAPVTLHCLNMSMARRSKSSVNRNRTSAYAASSG
jgi:hypothetical protein